MRSKPMTLLTRILNLASQSLNNMEEFIREREMRLNPLFIVFKVLLWDPNPYRHTRQSFLYSHSWYCCCWGGGGGGEWQTDRQTHAKMKTGKNTWGKTKDKSIEIKKMKTKCSQSALLLHLFINSFILLWFRVKSPLVPPSPPWGLHCLYILFNCKPPAK